MQHFSSNDTFEIMTPSGWKNFSGMVFNEQVNKEAKTLVFNNSSHITATLDHKFFINKAETAVCCISLGDKLDSDSGPLEIVSITDVILNNTYDIFNADGHIINVNNGLHTHQCDEFSFTRPSIANAFWTSMSPTLSTGGRCIITSTPNSDEDQFWEIWTQANKCVDEFGNTTKLGINGFSAFQATWDEHPDRDDAWAKAEEGRIGRERFLREFCCQPIIYEETLINSVRLAELTSSEPITKQGQVRWYQLPIKGKTYAVGLDPSLGTGGDNAAIQIFQLPEMKQVGEWVNNRTPIEHQVYILKEIVNYISTTIDSEYTVYYSIENNSLGEAALLAVKTIGEENIHGILLSEPHKPGSSRIYRKGYTTTNRSKLAACAKLKSLIETKKMIIVSKALISELKHFVALSAGFAAKPGEKDDLVMAVLLIIRMTQSIQSFDANIDAALSGMDEQFIEPMPFLSMTW